MQKQTLLSIFIAINLTACSVSIIAPEVQPETSNVENTGSSSENTDSSGANAPENTLPSGTGNASCERGEILSYQDVDFAEDLAFHNKHAYVFAKSKGIHIFDLNNPRSPQMKGILEDESGLGQAWDGVVADNKLFVAYRQSGVFIYDLSDPGNPQFLGQAQSEGFSADGVAISGNKLIASGGTGSEGRLMVYDISNPAQPEFIGMAAVSGSDSSGSSVAASGNTAYYGQAQGSLRVFDISGEPLELTQIDNPGKPGHSGWALGLSVKGNRLYQSNWGGGWIIYDISAPQSPKKLGTFADKFAAYDAHVVGNTLYGAAPEGLYLVDISDESKPQLIGEGPLNIKAPGELDDGAHGIHVENGIAYVADNKQQGLVTVCVAP